MRKRNKVKWLHSAHHTGEALAAIISAQGLRSPLYGWWKAELSPANSISSVVAHKGKEIGTASFVCWVLVGWFCFCFELLLTKKYFFHPVNQHYRQTALRTIGKLFVLFTYKKQKPTCEARICCIIYNTESSPALSLSFKFPISQRPLHCIKVEMVT